MVVSSVEFEILSYYDEKTLKHKTTGTKRSTQTETGRSVDRSGENFSSVTVYLKILQIEALTSWILTETVLFVSQSS